jgi:SpoVK/Ycf46/Vps4 family AAA+-type ATPase
MSAELVVTANVTAIEIALQIRDRVARNADLESDRLLARFKEARDAIAGFAQPTLDQVLALRCGLSDIELLAIWTLTAAAVSEHVRQLAVALGADKSGGQTSLVLGTILGGAGVARYSTLSPMAVLRRLALIERSDGGGPDVHESRWTWAISRRVLAFLHGDLSIDPALANIAEIKAPAKPIAQVAASEQVVAQTREAMKAGKVVVCVAGASGTGRRTLLAAAAAEAGVDVIEVDGRKLAKEPAQLKKQLKMIARECRLLARVPLIRNVDAVADVEAVGSELVSEIDGIVMVTCGVQRPSIRWGRPVIAIEMGAITSAQRVELWKAELGQGSVEDAEFLATQYPIAPSVIHHAAQAAKARAVGRKLAPEDIYAGIRTVLDDKLGDHAKRVTVTQTWDDLVLPDDSIAAVAGLIARVRQRRRVYEQWGFAAKVGKGLGTTALFSGPPGTGKTMVAALIARDLGLELYQVDMAKLVSKYIGETEKQLAALFDAAEAGHAILLFDEADSLFGKRTEVRSSNDRYANLETNYLLQRLESFTGICLLTTNHEANIDPAFERRLSVHVRFELPDVRERAKLWRAMLPEAAPIDVGVGFEDLARRFAMSGGYIRNAALRAAFLAADEGTAITQAHLEYAAQLEYEAMGKITVHAA